MRYNKVEHFSYNYAFNLDEKEPRKTDRSPIYVILPGMFFASILMFLGGYDLINGFKSSYSVFDDLIPYGVSYISMSSPIFFNISIIILGFGIIISLIFSYIRYRKFYINEKQIEITHRPAIGDKIVIYADLDEYEAIRYRTSLFHYGLFYRRKHIIELYHKEISKIIPLYISSNKNISKTIKEYAEKLNKPIITMTENGQTTETLTEFVNNINNQNTLK